MTLQLEPIFRTAFVQLNSNVPEMRAEFFPFAGLTHTARLRDERLLIRISDLLTDARSMFCVPRLTCKGLPPESRRGTPTYRGFILGSEIQERAAKPARLEDVAPGRRLQGAVGKTSM
jgi:hypothetical protein